MHKAFTGVVITIGDELLAGEVNNGNASFIASKLRQNGFLLSAVVTVGDDEEEIAEALRRALAKANFVIVTGGLGPTADDRTVAALSRAFDLPLARDDHYRQLLESHLARRGMEWSEELDKLTELPAGSTKLGLDMAGFALALSNIPCYFLPGVPHEMRQLLDEGVLPNLRARFPHRPVYRKQILRIQELTESTIGNRLAGASFVDLAIEVGYLPQACENWVTLLATAASETEATERLAAAAQRVISLLGAEYISGRDDEGLEWTIGEQLRARGWRIATAESCTGGLLSARIASVAGASDYFDRSFITYSNQAKREMLAVPEELLEQYGAVSEPVARAMADGAREKARVDVALAITGVAGPSGGSPEKPVGTVFIACSTLRQTRVEKHLFGGARAAIQEHSAHAALVLLWRQLSQ